MSKSYEEVLTKVDQMIEEAEKEGADHIVLHAFRVGKEDDEMYSVEDRLDVVRTITTLGTVDPDGMYRIYVNGEKGEREVYDNCAYASEGDD
jgi:hypothetical protein